MSMPSATASAASHFLGLSAGEVDAPHLGADAKQLRDHRIGVPDAGLVVIRLGVLVLPGGGDQSVLVMAVAAPPMAVVATIPMCAQRIGAFLALDQHDGIGVSDIGQAVKRAWVGHARLAGGDVHGRYCFPSGVS